jgi:hypothetical protein
MDEAHFIDSSFFRFLARLLHVGTADDDESDRLPHFAVHEATPDPVSDSPSSPLSGPRLADRDESVPDPEPKPEPDAEVGPTICPLEVAIGNCEFSDLHSAGDGGAIFVGYRPVVLRLFEVHFMNVVSDRRGGCLYFLGQSGNISESEAVDFGAAESGGFCHSVGSLWMSEVVAVRGSCRSGTFHVEWNGEIESPSSWCEIEGLNSSENEAASGCSGLEIEGGASASLRFARLIANSGGSVLSFGNEQQQNEAWHCLYVSRNSCEDHPLVSVALYGAFNDCVFSGNSNATLLGRHSLSPAGRLVSVAFRRCIFDSGTIAAEGDVEIKSESCAFEPAGEISLDPRYCSPFVTFRPTAELGDSSGFGGSEAIPRSELIGPSAPFGASKAFSSSGGFTRSEVFGDSATFGASLSLKVEQDSPKAEGANVFIAVGAGVGGLILVVVVIVAVVVCRKGNNGQTADGLLETDSGRGGGRGAGEPDELSDEDAV